MRALTPLFALLLAAACSDRTLKPPASDKNYDDGDQPSQTMPGVLPDAATDALPDGEGKVCAAQTDCAQPLRCIFPIAFGCTGKGVCALYTDPVDCASRKACACDGTTIALCSPDGTAPKPVKATGECASDAATE